MCTYSLYFRISSSFSVFPGNLGQGGSVSEIKRWASWWGSGACGGEVRPGVAARSWSQSWGTAWLPVSGTCWPQSLPASWSGWSGPRVRCGAPMTGWHWVTVPAVARFRCSPDVGAPAGVIAQPGSRVLHLQGWRGAVLEYLSTVDSSPEDFIFFSWDTTYPKWDLVTTWSGTKTRL